MNTELLKQQYNSYRYQMKNRKQIDWNNPNKADIEYNSKIEKQFSEWKKNLTGGLQNEVSHPVGGK